MAFSFQDLKKLKRNNFSRNIVDSLEEEFSSYSEALEDFKKPISSGHVDTQLKKYLLENPFAVCHAIVEQERDKSLEFLDELHERLYGDYMFAMMINHIRKLLCVQIINGNVPLPLDRREDASNIESTEFSCLKLMEYLSVNTGRNSMLVSAHEIVDFGFIKCAMMLNHAYGIQDVLAVLFRILKDKYRDSMDSHLQEATFAIPLDSAKYGIVAMVSDFHSFKLNGVVLDVENARDISDVVDAVEIYKRTQYAYRIGLENIAVPRHDNGFKLVQYH